MIPGIFGKMNDNPFKVRQFHARRKLTEGTKVRMNSLRRCIQMLAGVIVATFTMRQSLRILRHNASLEPTLSPLISIQANVEHPEKVKMPLLNKIFKAKTSQQRESLRKARLEFQQLQGKLKPCRLDGDCRGTTNDRILIRNSIPQNRYFCGHLIQGNGIFIFEKFPDVCSYSHSHLFSPGPPSVSGDDMAPIELFWEVGRLQLDNDKELKTVKFPCSIPCRTNHQGFGNIMHIISVKDTSWDILSTMEGEAYFPEAKMKPDAYQNDQFYATTSFKSEIPMPYFSWAEYKINNPAVEFDKGIKGASFLANNCNSISDRESLVKALLQTQLRIDALSGCFHNAEPSPGMDLSNSTQVQQHYLFYFAFENQRSEDYVTEKLWGSLRAGTLPIYFGAPNIRDHVPPNSVVFVDDYSTPQELADYLILLTKDKALYESYHKWRQTDLDEGFQKKYEFTKTHSTCRICKFAYAKKHGLGFDYPSQEVQQPQIPRMTCRNRVGLVGHPFKEYWLSGTTGKAVQVESDETTKTCSLSNDNRVLTVDHGTARRSVYDQDGVTDFVIDGKDEKTYLLKLETPILSNNLIEVDRQEHWLQDSASRLTILTSKSVQISLARKGTLQLTVQPPLRIRIIVEDVDHFHNEVWKHPSSFGQVMTQDFFFPLEAYRIVGS